MCYRKGSGCAKISVIEKGIGGNGDTAQHLEYVHAIRARYLRGSKLEKGKILDEFVQVTGMHRKAAARLLNTESRTKVGKRRGRRPKYSRDFDIFAFHPTDYTT